MKGIANMLEEYNYGHRFTCDQCNTMLTVSYVPDPSVIQLAPHPEGWIILSEISSPNWTVYDHIQLEIVGCFHFCSEKCAKEWIDEKVRDAKAALLLNTLYPGGLYR